MQLAQAIQTLEATVDAINAGDRSPRQAERYKLLVNPGNRPPLPAIWSLHASSMLVTLWIEEKQACSEYKAQWCLWLAKDCLVKCLKKAYGNERLGDHMLGDTLTLATEQSQFSSIFFSSGALSRIGSATFCKMAP